MKANPFFLLFFLAANVAVAQTSKPAANPVFRLDDVVATVDGQAITRRELTYVWLQTNAKTKEIIGELLAEQWTKNQGASPNYSVSSQAILQKLYSVPPENYANILSNLVTTRLVALRAKQAGVVVTKAQAQALAHELLETVRKQSKSNLSDDELLRQFKVPRDVFEKDMIFRLQAERLLSASIAKRNKHPIGESDWVVTRELFAEAKQGKTPEETERNFADAKTRLEAWIKEVGMGKTLEQAAREHNENTTKETGGSRGAVLRGTGTPAVETAIFATKPGQLSPPVRAANGWYVFQVERLGKQISAAERKQGWQTVIEARQNAFLYDLRKNAKIITNITLPLDDPNKPQ